MLVSFCTFVACKDSGENVVNGFPRKKAANEIEENIYRSADSMMAAFKRQDWKTFASYNHPR